MSSLPVRAAAGGGTQRVPLCSVSAGTGVLWWLYVDHRLSGNHTSATAQRESGEEAELRRDEGQRLLVYAVAASVFTVGPRGRGRVPRGRS